jgi:opacity protein-like surface antigen
MNCPILIISLSFLSASVLDASSSGLESRFQEVMARSASHNSLVASLLSKAPVKKGNLTLSPKVQPSPPLLTADPSQVDVPYISVPEYNDEIEVYEPEYAAEDFDDFPTPSVSEESQSFQSEINETIIEDSYDELYPEDLSQRGTGYYFGPLIGIVLPDDGAVRIGGITPYEAENGYLLGFNLGKDFGSISVEGEYSYFGADGSGGISIGVNNLLARVILEKEVGDAIDLRAGLGMGLGFISIEGGGLGEPSDVGFAYDFLLGIGYNFSDSLAVNFDYKYYLSAANDEYDRISAHCLLLSANFML